MSTVRIPSDLVSHADLLAQRPFTTRKQIEYLRDQGRLVGWHLGRRVYFSLSQFDSLLVRRQGYERDGSPPGDGLNGDHRSDR